MGNKCPNATAAGDVTFYDVANNLCPADSGVYLRETLSEDQRRRCVLDCVRYAIAQRRKDAAFSRDLRRLAPPPPATAGGAPSGGAGRGMVVTLQPHLMDRQRVPTELEEATLERVVAALTRAGPLMSRLFTNDGPLQWQPRRASWLATLELIVTNEGQHRRVDRGPPAAPSPTSPAAPSSADVDEEGFFHYGSPGFTSIDANGIPTDGLTHDEGKKGTDKKAAKKAAKAAAKAPRNASGTVEVAFVDFPVQRPYAHGSENDSATMTPPADAGGPSTQVLFEKYLASRSPVPPDHPFYTGHFSRVADTATAAASGTDGAGAAVLPPTRALAMAPEVDAANAALLRALRANVFATAAAASKLTGGGGGAGAATTTAAGGAPNALRSTNPRAAAPSGIPLAAPILGATAAPHEAHDFVWSDVDLRHLIAWPPTASVANPTTVVLNHTQTKITHLVKSSPAAAARVDMQHQKGRGRKAPVDNQDGGEEFSNINENPIDGFTPQPPAHADDSATATDAAGPTDECYSDVDGGQGEDGQGHEMTSPTATHRPHQPNHATDSSDFRVSEVICHEATVLVLFYHRRQGGAQATASQRRAAQEDLALVPLLHPEASSSSSMLLGAKREALGNNFMLHKARQEMTRNYRALRQQQHGAECDRRRQGLYNCVPGAEDTVKAVPVGVESIAALPHFPPAGRMVCTASSDTAFAAMQSSTGPLRVAAVLSEAAVAPAGSAIGPVGPALRNGALSARPRLDAMDVVVEALCIDLVAYETVATATTGGADATTSPPASPTTAAAVGRSAAAVGVTVAIATTPSDEAAAAGQLPAGELQRHHQHANSIIRDHADAFHHKEPGHVRFAPEVIEAANKNTKLRAVPTVAQVVRPELAEMIAARDPCGAALDSSPNPSQQQGQPSQRPLQPPPSSPSDPSAPRVPIVLHDVGSAVLAARPSAPTHFGPTETAPITALVHALAPPVSIGGAPPASAALDTLLAQVGYHIQEEIWMRDHFPI